MTESEKQEWLDKLKFWEDDADRQGLMATAQSWRETYDSVASRPAEDIVLARKAAGRRQNAAMPFSVKLDRLDAMREHFAPVSEARQNKKPDGASYDYSRN